MKKKYILLPLLLFTLASCNPVFNDDSSAKQSEDTSIPESSSSSQEAVVSSISVTNNPTKTDYLVGEAFEVDGLEVTATMSDGTTKVINNYRLSITNNYVFTVDDVGEKVVTVTYSEGITTSFNVNVTNNVTLEDIELSSLPTKTVYEIGENLDLNGLVVKAVYSDSSKETITDYVTSKTNGYAFVAGDVGSVNITVTYNNKSKSFNVTVNPHVDPAALVSIEITEEPNKLNYHVGDSFGLSGLVVTAIYSDNQRSVRTDYTSSIVPGYVFTDSDLGPQTVTITYEGKEASFNITVVEVSVKTIEDICDEMNALLPNTITNPFEARDYLVNHEYACVLEEQDNDEFFGYDYYDNQIAIYKMTNGNIRQARYPSLSVNQEVVSYQILEVNTLTGLTDAVRDVGIGVGNYSIIKLTANISLTDSIAITSSEPIELNLNNFALTQTTNKDVIRANGEQVVINVKNGDLVTFTDNTPKDLGAQDSPSCIAAIMFKDIVIDNVALRCNARYGYGVIDSIMCSNDSKVTIKNSNEIYAVTNAVCIKRATFVIKDSSINGIVNISGGNTTIDNVYITAEARHDDAEGLVPDSLVRERALYLYENNYSRYGDYSVSATDPIIIFDRRSIYDLYDNPVVNIINSRLAADKESEIVYGYGIRYIDLALGTKTTTATINVDSLTEFTKCSTPSNPVGSAGGINVELPH